MLSQNIVHYIPNIVHHRVHVCLIGQVITERLGPPQPGPVLLLLLLLLGPRLVALLGAVRPLEGEGVPHAAAVTTHNTPRDHWPLAARCVFRHSNLCWSWRYGS